MKANVASVMCAYNKANTTWICENKLLLSSILKDELDFQGFVVSGKSSGAVDQLRVVAYQENRLGCATHHKWKCKCRFGEKLST